MENIYYNSSIRFFFVPITFLREIIDWELDFQTFF